MFTNAVEPVRQCDVSLPKCKHPTVWGQVRLPKRSSQLDARLASDAIALGRGWLDAGFSGSNNVPSFAAFKATVAVV
jgi:hypothetical protein